MLYRNIYQVMFAHLLFVFFISQSLKVTNGDLSFDFKSHVREIARYVMQEQPLEDDLNPAWRVQ